MLVMYRLGLEMVRVYAVVKEVAERVAVDVALQ